MGGLRRPGNDWRAPRARPLDLRRSVVYNPGCGQRILPRRSSRKEPKRAQASLDRRALLLAGFAPDLVGSRGTGIDPGGAVRRRAELDTGRPVDLDRVVCSGVAWLLCNADGLSLGGVS